MISSTKTASRILVVGSINLDLVLRTSRLPVAGESVVGTQYTRMCGGKGANQAVAAARLGASTTFVGRIGTDIEGDQLRKRLNAEGVRTEFLRSCASSPTGLAVITLDPEGRNTLVVMNGANDEVSADDVNAAMGAARYDALLLQLEIPQDTVVAACALAAEHGVPIVLDAGPAQAFPLERLQGLHILSPNESETFRLTGIQPDNLEAAEAAARQLLERSNAQAVVLKLGERGALRCDGKGCELFPAQPVDAVDTTAAGDAFTAAMTIEYVRSGDLRWAVRRGTAAGALAACELGAQPSLPSSSQLDAFCVQRGVTHDG